MVEKLEECEAQHVAVNRRHAFDAPILRVLAQHGVEGRDVFHCPLEEAAGENYRRRTGLLRVKKRSDNVGGGMLADLPLEKHL